MVAFVLLVIWSCRTTVASGQWPVARKVASGQWLVANDGKVSSLASGHRPLATNLWPLAAEFSLIVLGMLLFSERTWKHHCVTLVLPCAVILYYLAVERPHPTLRWFLIGILSSVTLLMASTSINGLSTWWDKGAKLAQVYGAYVWAYLLLILALVVLLRRGSIQSSAEVIALRLRLSGLTPRSVFEFPEREPINPTESRTVFIPLSTQRNPPV
jgi:hypothetical protein